MTPENTVYNEIISTQTITWLIQVCHFDLPKLITRHSSLVVEMRTNMIDDVLHVLLIHMRIHVYIIDIFKPVLMELQEQCNKLVSISKCKKRIWMHNTVIVNNLSTTPKFSARKLLLIPSTLFHTDNHHIVNTLVETKQTFLFSKCQHFTWFGVLDSSESFEWGFMVSRGTNRVVYWQFASIGCPREIKWGLFVPLELTLYQSLTMQT